MSELSRTRGDSCLSDLAIDRLVRGETVGEAAEVARRHLGQCERCRARTGEVETARAAFQAAPPPLRRPQAARPPRRWARFTAATAGALAAAAAIVLVVRGGDERGARLKGGASIALYVQHNHEVRRAGAPERVEPGDTLQFVYSSAEPFYGAILSVDGAHHVSRYFPDGPDAVALEPGRERSFPRATELDEVLGRESIYVLFCRDAVALPPLEEALAANRPLAAPDCHVERIEIEKRRP